MRHLKSGFASLTLGFLLVVPQSGVAEEPAPSSPSFEVVSYQVEGNTILSASDINRIVQPFTGANRNFGDVQQALEALQKAYQKRGFGSVQVVLPEQELNKGVVQFKILEQKIGVITVEGNQFHDEANITQSLPSLKQGELPSTEAVAQDLRLVNENPSKQTTVLFKASETDENLVDATIKVTDEKPSKVFLTLDNTGNAQTGYYRAGVGFQHYNVLNHDDRFSAQFITSPESLFDDVKIFGFGYSRPIYSNGDSFDVMAGYSDVDAGSVLNGALGIASRGVVLGTKYNHNLRKIGDYEHKLVAGFDYKIFRPDISSAGVNQTPHASTTPLSLTYEGNWQKQNWQIGFNAGVAHNLAIGNNGDSDSLGINNNFAFPWLSDTYFTKFMFGADVSHTVFNNWVAHAGFDTQLTGDHLHPGEQFGIGGADSVRGWRERSFSADEGYRATIDITSPDFGAEFGDKVTMRSVFFIDHGYVSNNEDLLDTISGKDIHIASIGTGLRMSFNKNIIGRLDVAYVLMGDKTDDPAATHAQQRDEGQVNGNFSLVWIW